MKCYSVDEVADTLIALSRERHIVISNLKLQKLMYYAQAWNLVFSGRPLFKADFEAWVHGPVVPQLFRRFKEHRWADITSEVRPVHDEELRVFLGKILHTYGNYGATQLEDLTHSEEPWQEARKGTSPDTPSNARISPETMKRFYTRLAHDKRKAKAQG